MAEKNEETLYHRRLDRTPDKEGFLKLPEGDRRLVSQLRNAMEGVHNKVTALRDEVDEKDREANREAALRKAAESRLDQLVDMYGDPAVNEELRDRLPRARKEDVRQQWEDELHAMNDKNRLGKSVSFDDTDQAEERSKSGKPRSKSADSRHQRKHRTDSDISEEELSDEDYNPRSRRSRGHHRYPPGYPPPPIYGAMPYPPPPLQQYPGYYPAMYPTHAPVMGQPQALKPVYKDHSREGFKSGLYEQMMYGQQLSQAGAVFNPGTPMAQSTQIQGANMSTEHGLHPQSNGANETQGATSALISSMVASNNSASQSARDAVASREQTRQITLLLAELDAAKELNRKLEGRVQETEKELESLKLSQRTQSVEIEQQVSGRLAAMVEEIYAAQKQRDEAMMNRLRSANQERDEALVRLKHLETSLDHLNDNTELPLNLNVQELLSTLSTTSTSQDINDLGRHLVNEINNSLRRHKQIAVEEMRVVLEERDNSVAKFKELEAEVLKQQRMIRAKEADKEVHNTTQARLLATQQERDMALQRCQKLEEEIQTLQVYYSLHKSLSQEANLRDQYSNSLDHIEGALKQRDSMVDMTQKENNRLAAQFQSVVGEKNRLAEDLTKSQFAHKEALANQEKLERLVNVLRRKINGLGSKTDE